MKTILKNCWVKKGALEWTTKTEGLVKADDAKGCEQNIDKIRKGEKT